jgi:hypothetical protein
MMARSALAAKNLSTTADADQAYLEAKIILARYYAERTLPLVESSLTVIVDSAQTTVALDQASL